MKKLLLLLLMVVVGIVGCDKAEDNRQETTIITRPTIQEYYQEEAKKYNIDVNGVIFNYYHPDEIKNITTFTGLKNDKIWIRKYEYISKKEIFSVDGKEKLDTIITYTEPYVGEVIDTIKGFRISSLEYNSNDALIQIDYITKKNKTISDLSFCKEGIIVNNIDIKITPHYDIIPGIKYFIDCKYWLNDCWVVKYMIWDNTSGGGYEYFDYYSLTGNFMSSYKINERSVWGDEFDLHYITPLNMTEFIFNYRDVFDYNELRFKFSRINLEKDKYVWSTNVNLNVQNDTKVSLVKQELVSNSSTLQLIYNITLYDGTKSTKTVNIDVNTGKYTVN